MQDTGDGAPIRATVKWFNTAKGFGFVTPADGSPEAFLHLSALRQAGFDAIGEGAGLTVELSQSPKGRQVARVVEVDAGSATPARGDGGGFGDRGGFRDRGNNFGDRDNRRFDRDRERGDAEESVFSKKVRAGKRRTYFLDVRKTKGEDFFITITESTKREDGFGYRRHKIFLYKEDFNRFVASLNEVVDHVKNDLMPDFDYEEFDRRQAEWESQNREEEEEEDRQDDSKNVKNDAEDDVNW
jgi:cold shock CspA family protein